MSIVYVKLCFKCEYVFGYCTLYTNTYYVYLLAYMFLCFVMKTLP